MLQEKKPSQQQKCLCVGVKFLYRNTTYMYIKLNTRII